MFFYFRNEVYEKLSGKIKEAFASVKSASFTLDKVTVGRTPYTVLITYFFHRGEIKVENTANMVGLELMRFLGLTRRVGGSVSQCSVRWGVCVSRGTRTWRWLPIITEPSHRLVMVTSLVIGIWATNCNSYIYGDVSIPGE